jgi:hypothetical protein
MTGRDPWSLVTDESGKFSMGRVALWLTLLFSLRIVHADTFGYGTLSPLSGSLLTTLIIALVAWSAGPRLASYILPQLGAVIAAMSASAWRSASAQEPADPPPESTPRPAKEIL